MILRIKPPFDMIVPPKYTGYLRVNQSIAWVRDGKIIKWIMHRLPTLL